MKKLYSILLLTLIAIPALAVGELGAWDDLKSGSSPISTFFGIAVGIIVFVFIIYMWFASAKDGKLDKDINQLGCMGVIGIIAVILFLMVKCS